MSARHEGGSIESALHGVNAKKRGDGDPRDGAADADGDADGNGDDGTTTGHGARKPDRAEIDWLDPSARHAAQLAPPGLVTATAAPAHVTLSTSSP